MRSGSDHAAQKCSSLRKETVELAVSLLACYAAYAWMSLYCYMFAP